MRQFRDSSATVLAVTMASALLACNPAPDPAPPENEQVQRPQASAPADPNYVVLSQSEHFSIRNYKNAAIQAEGAAYTVGRTTTGAQGLSILPTNTDRPVMVNFSVSGDVESVRVFRLREWHNLPRRSEYAVRIGRGGALHLMIVPTRDGSATITISSAESCATLPADRCPVLAVD